MTNLHLALLTAALSLPIQTRAGTQLDSWHAYTHQPTGQTHYGFHLANYKRGLFLGSCGPSTRSLQWSFNIDLAGPGPTFERDQINLTTDDATPVPVVSGQIFTDPSQKTATISLVVDFAGARTNFVGNGTFHIRKSK
jgi:hypothetical protein